MPAQDARAVKRKPGRKGGTGLGLPEPGASSPGSLLPWAPSGPL